MIHDDAVLAAANRVHQRGHAVSALRVALELKLEDAESRPDESAAEQALLRLVDAGRLWHTSVVVEWTAVPGSASVLDYYLPVYGE